MLEPVSVRIPVPAFVMPAVPASTDPIVALALVVIVGDTPARVIVPLEIVAVWPKVRLFAQTVPLTNGVAPAVLNSAALVSPLVMSHGVPLTLDQLVALVSHEAPAPPVQVAVEASTTDGRDAARMAVASGVTLLRFAFENSGERRLPRLERGDVVLVPVREEFMGFGGYV